MHTLSSFKYLQQSLPALTIPALVLLPSPPTPESTQLSFSTLTLRPLSRSSSKRTSPPPLPSESTQVLLHHPARSSTRGSPSQKEEEKRLPSARRIRLRTRADSRSSSRLMAAGARRLCLEEAEKRPPSARRPVSTSLLQV